LADQISGFIQSQVYTGQSSYWPEVEIARIHIGQR